MLATAREPSGVRSIVSDVRVLGVNCTPHGAYLAVAEEGVILPGHPDQLKPPAGLEVGGRLLEFISDIRNVLAQIKPDRVGLLLAEPKERGGTHQQHMPRLTIETLVRVAAAQEGLPVDLVQRATVRSKLGLSKTKSLDTHLPASGVKAVGKYWNQGRGLAALAAVAGTTS